MIAVKLTKHFVVNGHEGVDRLDVHTDQVMDELLKLENENIFDADIAVMLSAGEVEISIVGVAVDFDAAAALADSAIRTAIHAADGATPEWQPVGAESHKLEFAG